MAANTRWTKLNWEDPFELDAQLTEEQRMVRDSARQYAQQALQPRVKEAFRTSKPLTRLFFAKWVKWSLPGQPSKGTAVRWTMSAMA